MYQVTQQGWRGCELFGSVEGESSISSSYFLIMASSFLYGEVFLLTNVNDHMGLMVKSSIWTHIN